ncbi:hypothetical protein Back2_17830 [Nocardioides baekrokdamisoli]|uniref:Rho termination factor N-terminal domain-containing protein n=1 Tax=Nocardioides baekrokdamisoli TaxID=1804624 RepID=A0A3G9IGN5_9ACTN|nr:hypothetical protein [Nocardioides baekrokdamisoli]BBH17496.1 hypothetical protein Back2_17830 [Nocardioides baekrokdamisoli]
MAKILIGKSPLTIVKNLDGTHRYVYQGSGVDAAALDQADAERLIEGGHLAVADAVPSDGDIDLAKANKAALLAHAETLGLSLNESATKAQIVEAIEAHVAEQDDEA